MAFKKVPIVLFAWLSLTSAREPIFPGSTNNKVSRDVPFSHALHESQTSEWSDSWKAVRKAPGDLMLPVRIGLRQKNLQEGEDLLFDISNPKSPNFGQHMSSEEVTSYFAPDESSVNTVTRWLLSSGISKTRIHQSKNKQWLQIQASVDEMESLLYTDFFIFQRTGSGLQSVAVEKYHLPHQIRDHVDYITPAVKEIPFRNLSPNPRGKSKREDKKPASRSFQHAKREQHVPKFNFSLLRPDNCHNYLTIECIRAQYDIPNNTIASEGNKLGIFESLGHHFSKVALDIFFGHLHPYIPPGTYPEMKLINGAVGAIEDGFIPENMTVESNLDLMSAMPIIWPQTPVIFQTGDIYSESKSDFRSLLDTFFNAIDGSYCNSPAYGVTGNCNVSECQDPINPNPDPAGYQGDPMCGTFEPTNVISISYYGGEAYFPPAYLKRQCLEIMKLGLQGVTVVVLSGDFGVGSFPFSDGGYPNGCAGSNGTVFIPSIPGSCPYLLTVGGTILQRPSGSEKLHEIAPTTFSSGGGFSNHWKAPDWQKEQIQDYFRKVNISFTGYKGTYSNTNISQNSPTGVYNMQGRGFPDVAAFATNFLVFNNGTWGRGQGTSLSAPIWGAILTLINENRLKIGKKTIGFINPILYAHPEVFNDIIVGSNPACGSEGFQCTKEWDPVTGLGTPRYRQLLDLFLSLP